MPKIKMPNGDIVNFPDDMPKDEVRAIISKKFPNEISAYNEDGFRVGGEPKIGNAISKTVEDISDIPLSAVAGATNIPNLIIGGGGDIYDAGGRFGNYLMNKVTGQNREYEPTEVAKQMITSKDVAANNPLNFNYEPKTGIGKIIKLGTEIVGSHRLSPAGGNIVGKSAEYVKEGAENLARGINPKNINSLFDDSQEIKFLATESLGAMRKSGQGVTQNGIDKIIKNMQSEITDSAIAIDPELHAGYTGALKYAQSLSEKGGATMAELENLRTKLNNAIRVDKSSGGPAILAKDAFDESLPTLGKGDLTQDAAEAIYDWKKGMEGYSKAKGLEQIAKEYKASGGDPENFRRRLAKIIDNPKLAGRFSSDELEALKGVGINTPEKLVRALGRTGIDLGTDANKGRIFNSLLTDLVIPGSNGRIPLIGTIANYAQKPMFRGKLDRAIEEIVRPADAIAPDVEKSIQMRINNIKEQKPTIKTIIKGKK